MSRHRIAAATTGITALLITMLILASPGASSSHRSTGDGLIQLGGDVTPEVRRLASAVVRAAHEHGEQIAPTELEIRFVDRVESEGFLGGWTDGRLILVGRNLALPERTLLHEIAHAAVGVDVGHGEPWRSVYITAFRNEFGERKAERELRRLRWVYDRSYLDKVPQPCQIPDDSQQQALTRHPPRGCSTARATRTAHPGILEAHPGVSTTQAGVFGRDKCVDVSRIVACGSKVGE